MISAIATVPPYAHFIREVARHSIVSGIRLNTVMPIKGNIEDVLKRLADQADGKDVWIDLKGRQLRVEGYWQPPFTSIQVSHNLTVDTPVAAYFDDGKERATVVEVDGNKLIMQEGPKRVVGPGESINIIHPSLSIEGYFTPTDLRYIEAGKNVGLKQYMLSYVECAEDITNFTNMYPGSEVVAKIESEKGLRYIASSWNNDARLMAARGDLYIEVRKPHLVIQACEDIVKKDPTAIVASRIFPSLMERLEPSCADIGDADNLMRMGYKTFMLGDDICMHRETLVSGLNLLEVMAERYQH